MFACTIRNEEPLYPIKAIMKYCCLIRGTTIKLKKNTCGYLYHSSSKRSNQRRKVRRIPWQLKRKENDCSNKKGNHKAFANQRPGETPARLVKSVEVVAVPHCQIGCDNLR